MASPDSLGNETEHCLKFSKAIADVIFDIKVVLGSIGVLLSLFAIVLIGVSKIYKQFVYRLVMYLMAVNITQALCQVIELIPIQVVTENERITIRNGTGWTETCAVLGYLDIVTAWMGNFVIVWVMLYMLMLSWQLYRLQSNQQTTSLSTNVQNKSHTREIVGVILLVLTPFLFSWIPFVMDMYGISGLWCWIRTASDNGCKDPAFQHLSLTLMLVMFYGPLVGILIFGLVCLFSIIILLRRSSRDLHGAVRQRYQSSIKEIGLVLIYPFVYCLFCFLLLVNRVYSSTHTNSYDHPPNYPLWVIHAIADPGRILIPALAFLLHPHMWKNVLACRAFSQTSETACTNFQVPPEGDDINEGYTIRPSDGGYGSVTTSLLFPKANGNGN